MAISLDAPLPTRSSDLPGARRAASSHLLGLAPNGVYLAARVTAGAGALLPHPFTLTWTFQSGRFAFCGTFHASPRLGVTQRPALWSPDFPRTARIATAARDHLADSQSQSLTVSTQITCPAVRVTYASGVLSGAESRFEVRDQVVDRFNTDGQPHQLGPHAGGTLLKLGQLRMRGGRGVDDQAADVADVGQVAEQLDRLHKGAASFRTPGDPKGHDRPEATGQVLLGPPCQSLDLSPG